MKCEICKIEFVNIRGLSIHISKIHKEIKKCDYHLNNYLTKNDDLFCPICGKMRKFKDISYGFRSTCGSKKCKYELARINRQKTFKEESGEDNCMKIETHKETAYASYMKPIVKLVEKILNTHNLDIKQILIMIAKYPTKGTICYLDWLYKWGNKVISQISYFNIKFVVVVVRESNWLDIKKTCSLQCNLTFIEEFKIKRRRVYERILIFENK